MSTAPALGPSILAEATDRVRRPNYDRQALEVGMAHVGVGAFHRCHQAEYTDDLLEQRFDRWGVVGINIRDPRLDETLGQQAGLYTRLLRNNETVDARIIGCMVSTVDSQSNPEPALQILASSEIDVVTLTVTEKGYCHKPANGLLDRDHPDIVHDVAHPTEPRSLPGLLASALERRMQSHGQPVTVVSCDNIPSNGAILENVVRAMAERRGTGLTDWITANVAFPSTMVDRIVPATSDEDRRTVEEICGYRDRAPVVGEPFRQWVIENRFAGRTPPWDLAGATFAGDVTAFELLKMRVLNASQTTLCYLGLLAGHEHTCDDMTDPVLTTFLRRMLLDESLPTLPSVPGVSPERYVEQSFARLSNTAIRHRNHQIATDGSQKIVQRILNPIRERLRKDQSVELLSVAVAAWIVYLIYGSRRFGRRWVADDPFADHVAVIADRVGHDSGRLTNEILAVESVFDKELFEQPDFRETIARHLDGLLSDEPIAYVRRLLDATANSGSSR